MTNYIMINVSLHFNVIEEELYYVYNHMWYKNLRILYKIWGLN